MSKYGTVKMLKNYIASYHIDLNKSEKLIFSIFKEKVFKFLRQNFKLIEFLINQSNFCYSYITIEGYKLLGYNFQPTNRVVVNKENDRLPAKLEKLCPGKEDYFILILTKYQKLFLVISKAMNQPKNLKKSDLQAIFKYM
jgi:hypothetical protein